MTITVARLLLMTALLSMSALLNVPTAPASVLSASLCPQPGLTPGCRYIVTYSDGTADDQTADGGGNVYRPCNKIITGVRPAVPSGGCSRAVPIGGVEC